MIDEMKKLSVKSVGLDTEKLRRLVRSSKVVLDSGGTIDVPEKEGLKIVKSSHLDQEMIRKGRQMLILPFECDGERFSVIH